MRKRLPPEPDSERLPEPVATRLLARATELDAAYTAGTAVAELRTAAAEAGISAHAFDAALAELHAADAVHVPDAGRQPRRRLRIGTLAATAALIAAGAVAVTRLVVSVDAAPMVEQAFLLRCLSPGEGAELIRPLLDLRTNTVAYSPAQAPRVLTVRATPEQIRNVRAVLERYDGGASSACATRPAPR